MASISFFYRNNVWGFHVKKLALLCLFYERASHVHTSMSVLWESIPCPHIYVCFMREHPMVYTSMSVLWESIPFVCFMREHPMSTHYERASHVLTLWESIPFLHIMREHPMSTHYERASHIHTLWENIPCPHIMREHPMSTHLLNLKPVKAYQCSFQGFFRNKCFYVPPIWLFDPNDFWGFPY